MRLAVNPQFPFAAIHKMQIEFDIEFLEGIAEMAAHLPVRQHTDVGKIPTPLRQRIYNLLKALAFLQHFYHINALFLLLINSI